MKEDAEKYFSKKEQKKIIINKVVITTPAILTKIKEKHSTISTVLTTSPVIMAEPLLSLYDFLIASII